MTIGLFFIFSVMVTFYPYYRMSRLLGGLLVATNRINGYHWLTPYFVGATLAVVYSGVLTAIYALVTTFIG